MPKVDGGKTVRIVLRGCGETAAGGLSDQGFVEWSAIELCRVLGMTAVGDTVTRVIAPGLSTVLVIAESHIAIHTWPESSSVRVIIDSCVDFNDKAAAEWLNDTFSSAAYNVFLV